jgi:hypothetical protein
VAKLTARKGLTPAQFVPPCVSPAGWFIVASQASRCAALKQPRFQNVAATLV